MKDSLFIIMQYLLPQHLLSRLTGWLAGCQWAWVKNSFISWFIQRYQVDMSQAADSDPLNYLNFNAFFTRTLKDGARPVSSDESIVACPADGMISQLGPVEHGNLLQAKGRYYSVTALLGGDPKLAEEFEGGDFATVYLSPRDYHRVHMPLAGVLRQTIYVPGKLFSVNQLTSERVDQLFARNERLVCIFDTDHGPMAVVLVGAMIVAGIDTVWAGQAAPSSSGRMTSDFSRQSPPVQLARAAEIGRFRLGSTAIVLFGPGMIKLQDTLQAGSPVLMGQTMGALN
jgi:phosphatidylserine decarboxylase